MLTIESLKQDKKNRNKETHKLYKKVLELVYEKIKNLNNQNYKRLVYQPPQFIMENPTYNQNLAYKYIFKKLSEGGFLVKPMFNNTLDISW